MTIRRSVLLGSTLLCLGLLSSWGCKKKAPATAAESRPTAAPSTTETRVPPPPAPSTSRDTEADVLSQDLAEINRRGYLTDAFFDYDKSDLREDARTALANDAAWLKKYPSVKIMIEGHCDERGTQAYNLALGDRRANAAKEYLASMAIDASRVRTVSYGKERPFCTDSNESCWQQNRRGHIVVTAK
jgi:peptidoglycan-associated lipoprotein